MRSVLSCGGIGGVMPASAPASPLPGAEGAQTSVLAASLQRTSDPTQVAQARDVPSRVRQAGDEPKRHRITGARHHDWDGVRGVLSSADRGGSPSHNHVHLELEQLGRQVEEPLLALLRIAVGCSALFEMGTQTPCKWDVSFSLTIVLSPQRFLVNSVRLQQSKV